MHKTRSPQLPDSTRPSASRTEVSTAHAILDVAEPTIESGSGQHSKGTRVSSLSALDAEIARLEAELDKRDQEIQQLRARLLMYEAAPPAARVLLPVEGATPAEPEPLFAATPPGGSEFIYPTLKRVAMRLEACSLLPPPISASQPPSQRRAPRRSCEIELEFTEDTHFYAGLTQDISQGGVFIATYKVLPVGHRLQLEFDLPDGMHVSAKGEVRWLREAASATSRPGMGVAFLDLPDDSRQAITEFCRKRPPLYMDL